MKKQNHVRRMSRGAGKQQESLGLRRRRRRTWNVPSWARPQAENDNGEAWYQVSEPPTKVALADFGHSCERGERRGPRYIVGIRYVSGRKPESGVRPYTHREIVLGTKHLDRGVPVLFIQPQLVVAKKGERAGFAAFAEVDPVCT